MKWYLKEFCNLFVASNSKVKDYLNKLNDNGVKPEHIKIVGMDTNWCDIYYYHDKEIE